VYCVLQARRRRRGHGFAGKQERAYLAVRLYLEDPNTPNEVPSYDYRRWRKANPHRRLPSADFVADTFGGWRGVRANFGDGVQARVLARRMTATGRRLSRSS
jgi:hypothetical protein